MIITLIFHENQPVIFKHLFEVTNKPASRFCDIVQNKTKRQKVHPRAKKLDFKLEEFEKLLSTAKSILQPLPANQVTKKPKETKKIVVIEEADDEDSDNEDFDNDDSDEAKRDNTDPFHKSGGSSIRAFSRSL